MNLNNVEAIVAVDSQFGIAKNGAIPWYNKTDLQYFKQKTTNHIVIMGSKTLLSLPNSKPLPNRMNIVITHHPETYVSAYSSYSNIRFVTFEQSLFIIRNEYLDKTFFIIGGNQIYNAFIPYCSIIWLTQVKKDYNCDLFLNIDLTPYIPTITYTDTDIEIMKLCVNV